MCSSVGRNQAHRFWLLKTAPMCYPRFSGSLLWQLWLWLAVASLADYWAIFSSSSASQDLSLTSGKLVAGHWLYSMWQEWCRFESRWQSLTKSVTSFSLLSSQQAKTRQEIWMSWVWLMSLHLTKLPDRIHTLASQLLPYFVPVSECWSTRSCETSLNQCLLWACWRGTCDHNTGTSFESLSTGCFSKFHWSWSPRSWCIRSPTSQHCEHVLLKIGPRRSVVWQIVARCLDRPHSA